MGSLKSSPRNHQANPGGKVPLMEAHGCDGDKALHAEREAGSLLISCFADSSVFCLERLAAIGSFHHSCLCTGACTLNFQANRTKIFILLLKPTPIWSQPSVAGRGFQTLGARTSQSFTSFQKRGDHFGLDQIVLHKPAVKLLQEP